MRRTLLILALAALVAVPARAQAVKLAFNEGRVSIDAASVPVRTILNEWARLGGTKVVGADRIAGAPLTLTLVDVPESQALDIILRSVAGYMAAPRSTAAGASIYDRILVMATSSTPPPAAARPAAPAQPGAGAQRFVPPNRQPFQQPAEPDVSPDEDDDPSPPDPPVFTFPQPGNPGQPGIFNGQVEPQAGQIINVNPSTGAPEIIMVNPAPQPSAPSPGLTAPFGAPGSSMPGVIQRLPTQPGQIPQPGPMVRPPG